MIVEMLWVLYSTLGVILILSSPVWIFLIGFGLYRLAVDGWKYLTQVDEDDINVIEAIKKNGHHMRVSARGGLSRSPKSVTESEEYKNAVKHAKKIIGEPGEMSRAARPIKEMNKVEADITRHEKEKRSD